MKKQGYSESNKFLNDLDATKKNSSYSESKTFVGKVINGLPTRHQEGYGESTYLVKHIDNVEVVDEPKEEEKEDDSDDDDSHHQKEEHHKKLKSTKVEQKTTPLTIATSNKGLTLVIKSEGQSTAQKEKVSKVMHVVSMVLVYLFLVLAALLFIFPFYWMILTSFKSGAEIKGTLTGYEGVQTFWPVDFMNNYADLGRKFNFGMYIGNTLVVGVFSTIGTVITCILSAFAFSRLQFKGKNLIFTLFLSTMMIPGEMMVISNYITVSNFGWTDGSRTGAYLAMIVPFMVSVFYIYLLRQNFMQIPNELYLAAKVDGKSDWQYLWTVMVPLAMPSIITILILKLIGSWNSYIWPNLISGGNETLRLVSNGLRDSFQTGTNFDEYGRQMAATVLVTVPLLLVFIIFRKYIMRGVSRAGIKG